jgi:urea carboxylase
MLVEYGEQVLDISLRFRAHALMQWLQQHPLDGLQELTPGIRSLQLHFDSQRLSHRKLLLHLKTAEQTLASQIDQLHVPSRVVHIPLSWDDQACQKAIEKYAQSVRKNAPWCPSNLEFIRRINGLESIDDVKQIVFDASYLVMGLGDVYLGAPVATPVDPRHRLVTTKYNPARTWTAENSVGIGGSYLCVYGMEGPGGYQFVGRTLQMWNRYKQTAAFEKPWLLRFFDQIRFYEVSHDELVKIRKGFPQGRYPINIEETTFSLTEYQDFIVTHQADIEAFRCHRQQAFETELAQWHANGQFNFEVSEQTEEQAEAIWPEESLVIDSPISGSVWQTEVAVGQQVKAGDCLMILESMKMEIPVYASADSRVTHVLLENGQRVRAGQALVVLQEG